jgi:hypothetical protein
MNKQEKLPKKGHLVVKLVDRTAYNKGIAKSRAEVHFIINSSLVILRSSFRNSYQFLLLTASKNYKSARVPGETFNEYPAFSNT